MSLVAEDIVRIATVDKARGYWASVFRRLARDPVSVTCATIILLIALGAILAPYLGLANPYTGSMIRRLRWIGTPGYPLGTDELGRDMFSRLIYGGRLSLFLGLCPVVLAFMIGTTFGVMAGYLGGFVNQAIMRTVDVFYAFRPCCSRSRSPARSAPASSLDRVAHHRVHPPIVRVASVTTSVRTLEFVEGARASGAGPITSMRVHVLGNVLGPIFVYSTSLISVCMILASGLSFLGLGTKPPEPEWGLMLNTLRTAIYANPWVAALPGAMIFIVSICFNLLSDGMRSAMDVRS